MSEDSYNKIYELLESAVNNVVSERGHVNFGSRKACLLYWAYPSEVIQEWEKKYGVYLRGADWYDIVEGYISHELGVTFCEFTFRNHIYGYPESPQPDKHFKYRYMTQNIPYEAVLGGFFKSKEATMSAIRVSSKTFGKYS